MGTEIVKKFSVGRTLGLVALLAAAGGAVAAIVAYRRRHETDDRAMETLELATHEERDPSPAEFSLIQDLSKAGWPTSHQDFKFATTLLDGVYVLLPLSEGTANLRRTADGTSFELIVFNGITPTGVLTKPGLTFAEFQKATGLTAF